MAPPTIQGNVTPVAPAPLTNVVIGTDPAAGVEISQTVPANERWALLSVVFVLVTSAAVANRRVVLTIDDGTNIVFRSNTSTDQTAGLTLNYCFAKVGARANDLAQNETLGMLPDSDLVLMPGWRIRTATLLKDAGDNFGAPAFAILKV